MLVQIPPQISLLSRRLQFLRASDAQIQIILTSSGQTLYTQFPNVHQPSLICPLNLLHLCYKMYI